MKKKEKEKCKACDGDGEAKGGYSTADLCEVCNGSGVVEVE